MATLEEARIAAVSLWGAITISQSRKVGRDGAWHAAEVALHAMLKGYGVTRVGLLAEDKRQEFIDACVARIPDELGFEV